VPRECAAIDNEVLVQVRGNMVRARVIPTPFYRRPKRQA